MVVMDRHDNPPLWVDKPEPIAFYVELNAENKKTTRALDVGNCAIALFRHRPDLDYLAIKDEQEEGRWTFIFDKQPLIYWMGGVALDDEGQRQLHLMNRTNGTFESRYKWSPDVVIESYPSQSEVDVWVDYHMDRDLDAEFTKLLKPDTGDPDGA